MKTSKIAGLDWPRIACDLDREGYALLPGLLDAEQIHTLLAANPEQQLANWRAAFYAQLLPIAQRWNQRMGIAADYPASLTTTPDSVILSHLYENDFQPLHQNSNGERTFPLQLVMLLSEPGVDFSGGELVMTEQRPRMQSRPMVLPLTKGDAALITVAQRPVSGSNGDYRVNLKQAISRVLRGNRLGLELLFHDRSIDPGLTLDQGTLAFDAPAVAGQ